ncbi:BTAD domain-containing putative transcriptional regulator [Kribbella albertanoniae]|uniref:Tetratricopeptide repeat protein n=1 Tax=Kribbella albertanoniae TaxID=1266829 RepID=A0A4R4QFV2_9ACTN|nr:BTAD domain-containing putative transcriptional regulator [Kribbella albertanoniae]TDC34437.1 tetratricopeptide repeat protein [Kribbella albertanoniae]
MPSGLRIDLLGPLTVRSGDAEISVGPLRQQAMFAVLALNAHRVLTPEQLLDLVWDDDPPPTGIKVVPTYVYRIRKSLPPDARLERTTAGYVLRLDPGVLDLERFETTVRAAGLHSDPEQALALHDQALALFRGQPLSGLPGQYLAGQRRRIAERREKALGTRIQLQLAAGRHVEAIPELISLVADHPFDERFAVLLMNALAGSGRQAEALETYQRVRRTLVEQLGIEPGPELRAAQQTLLQVEAPAVPSRNELPYGGAAFAGRAAELAEVVAALRATAGSAPPVFAIDGMAGIGKTALAVQAGHLLAAQYPDGQLFVDLHGHTPGREPLGTEQAVDHLLRGIGVPADQIPGCLEDRLSLWRSKSARLRLLVVLDNAPEAETVRRLLPGASGCAVLVTSRRLLVELDAKRRLGLGLLEMDAATALLIEIAGPDRHGGDESAVRELAEHCGRLPLALRIAGARLRHRPAWSMQHLNQRLRGRRRLRELDGDSNGVRSAFAVSYEHLPEDQRRMFACLGLFPGKDFDANAAAALAGIDVPAAEVLLESLVDASLLLGPRPGRYEFHDLLRGYAAEVADDAKAVGRLVEYYLTAAGPEPDPTWADVERPNLLAALEVAEDAAAVRFALVLAPYLHGRSRLDELDAVLTIGLAAAVRQQDAVGEARLLFLRGNFGQFRCGPQKGLCDLRRAAELAPEDEPGLRARILGSLGYTQGTLDPSSSHADLLRTSLRLAHLAGDREAVVETLGRLAALAVRQHGFAMALEYYERALDLAREIGDERLEPELLNGIAVCRLAEDNPLPALEATRAAQRLAAAHELDFSMSYALCHQGEAHRRLGRTKLAVEIHEQALTLAIGNCTHLDEVDARLHLGRSLLSAGRGEPAAEQFELAFRLSQDRDHPLGIVEALTGLADCAPQPGRADRLLRRARDVAFEAGYGALATRLECRLERRPAVQV